MISRLFVRLRSFSTVALEQKAVLRQKGTLFHHRSPFLQNGLQTRLRSSLARYRELIKANPMRMGFCFCFLKGTAASIFAQRALEQKGELDRRRVLAMALFSGIFTGCGYHLIFNVAFRRFLGPVTSVPTLLRRVVADGVLVFPFMYMPCFLFFDELVRFGSLEKVYPRWAGDIHGSLVDYVKIWPIANVLSFTVVPLELRVTFMASVSFLWLIWLSATSA